jgi:uncharacterized protein (UPF0264 family)
MRVLVSVRAAAEVPAAVAGGAAVVDAKEPARGALGPVGPTELAAIGRALPDGVPLSVALGDPADENDLTQAFGVLESLAARPGELIVKIGLAGLAHADGAAQLLAHGVGLAAASRPQPQVMAVVPVDGGLDPNRASAAAASAGVHGVVLDTWRKDGRDLFAWIDEAGLARWIARTRARGLSTALAGSLSLDGVARAARLGPDTVGVRGAACVGGRSGRVDEGLVRSLVAAASGSGAVVVPIA